MKDLIRKKIVNKEPDSLAVPTYAIRVDDAESNPEFGQVEVRVWHNARQSTSLRLTLEDAEALADKLRSYVNKKKV